MFDIDEHKNKIIDTKEKERENANKRSNIGEELNLEKSIKDIKNGYISFL